jgi:hypothetical protein
MWKIGKWARLRSHGRPDDVTMPPLSRSEGAEPTAYTHAEKAELLAERFFPSPQADLSDIVDVSFEGNRPPDFAIDDSVDYDEITQILRSAGAWKAPGTDDLLPTGFLRACGPRLAHILAVITSASFAQAYFPRRFRHAGVVVLRKPGKSTAARKTPGAYRPIALLSTIGKVIETAMGRRIANAAEEHSLLPNGQMGNRRARSTELAIRVVTEAVQAAWRSSAVASLLQLDIKGAFDTVNHIRMLDTLRAKGFPI